MNKLFILSALTFILTACGNSGSDTQRGDGDTLTTTAKFLTLVNNGDYVEAIITDPWKEGNILGHYALVADSMADITVPDELTRVNVPLKKAIVFSMVHGAAIGEIGAFEAISATADVEYLPDSDPMKTAVSSGKIADIGSSMSPSIEKIIDLGPDAILYSPYEGGSTAIFDNTGIPLILMADYAEQTPLGRAEWIKLIGHLFGKPQQADSIYTEVSRQYESIKQIAQKSRIRPPKVITEKPYQGVWYVPGGASYMAALLHDAGGDYPWSDDTSVGSLSLDEAAVIDRGADAEYWLVKESADSDSATFIANMPHAKAFNSFPDGVYVCNTVTTDYYRDIAFHPDRILHDFYIIFHPSDSTDTGLRYHKPLKK